MRRGIGVAHVQQKKQQSLVMADLGASMTAERISLLADQLDGLKQKYTELAQKYQEDIRSDPLARTKLRQLGDALGVTVSSSQPSLLTSPSRDSSSRDLHLAAAVIEMCVQERKYFGATIPVEHIRFCVKKRGGFGDVSAADVQRALHLLAALGPGYEVITVDGENYIQTVTGSGVSLSVDSADALRVQAFARLKNAALTRVEEKLVGGSVATLTVLPGRRSVGCSLSAREHEGSKEKGNTSVEASTFIVFHAGIAELQAHFESWPPQRLHRAIQREVLQGNVWVEDLYDGCASAPQYRYWFVGTACGGFLTDAAA